MSISAKSLGQRNSMDAKVWAAKKRAREAKAKKLREERQQRAQGKAPDEVAAAEHRLLASESHRHNEGYMEDFYAALKEMEHGSSGAKADYDDFGRRVRSDSGLEAKKRSDSSTRNSTLAGSTVGSARRTSSNCLQRSGAGRSQVDFLAWDPALDGGLPGNLPEIQFQGGPLDEHGIQLDMSDRNILCMSVNHRGNELCFGSADHAAYVYDLEDLHCDQTRRGAKRQLYSKSCGHSDWVTAVAFSPSGHVYSGGMDGQLLRWDSSSRVEALLAKGESPVSVLQTLCHQDVCVAGNYRGELCVFSSDTRTTLRAHDAPVMAMDVGGGIGSLVLSGDRNGLVACSDLARPELTASVLGEHQGHCTCAKAAPLALGPCAASGGQDGLIKVWDRRKNDGPMLLPAHRRKKSGRLEVGAVADVIWRGSHDGGDDNYLISGGADKKVVVSDVRMGRPLHSMKGAKDFVYAMACYGDAIFVGTGDGMILCHDLKRGKNSLLWGLGGTSMGAVRALAAVPSQRALVSAGDDGKAVVWKFPA